MSKSTTRTPKPKFRVLVVDDHPFMRRGICDTLVDSPDYEICGEASEAGEALQLYQTLKPDLVIVDISLAAGSGLELVKQLCAIDPDVKALVLSMHDENLYAERALRAGARGYVSKDEPPEVLLAAMSTIMRGEIALSTAMTNRLLKRAVDLQQPRRVGAEALSDREVEVLQLIGMGVRTRKIAEQLHISVKTVETHRAKLKVKLNLESGADLNRYATMWVNGAA